MIVGVSGGAVSVDWNVFFILVFALVAVAWVIWRALKTYPPEPPVPPPSPPPSPLPPSPPPPPPPGSRQRISIIVRSPSYPAAYVAAYIGAQQVQISGEFAPAFGLDAEIILETGPSPGSWPVYLDEASDVPGDLGYHGVDDQGVPYARVFLQDSRAANVSWQSVASHEVLEILADPSTAKTVIGPNGRPWAYEVGDPVEDIEYFINGVPMSNFVFPRWFAPGYTGQVDDRHVLLRAYQVTSGGYAQWRDTNGNWIEVSGPSGRKARK